MDYSAGLLKKILEAVENCAPETGVLFSGGIDSTVVAVLAKKFSRVTCYTAGVGGSHDLEFAGKVAELSGLNLVKIVLSEKQVENYAGEVMLITGLSDPVSVGVGVPILACCKTAREKVLLSGTGADELFGGYARFKDSRDLEKDMAASLEKCLKVDLKRDTAIAKHFGKDLRAPYLDRAVVEAAKKVPAKQKVFGGQNKIVLREIGNKIGVPEFVCVKPKKAAQYGSGVHKALERLAKKRGLALKDYLHSLKTRGISS